jgi:hypothetical protein
LTVTGATPGRLWSADDEESVDWTLTGRRNPAHDLGALHDQRRVCGLKRRGDLIRSEQAIRIRPGLAFGTVKAVVTHDQEPAAGRHRGGGSGIDGFAFVDRQVEIGEDHEAADPRLRDLGVQQPGDDLRHSRTSRVGWSDD